MRSLQNVAAGSMRKRIPGSIAWLEHPAFFAAASPIFTLLGAGTTLIAPRLLDPVQFGAFALVTALFQYTGAADLGLSRLADRRIAGQGLDEGDKILRVRWRIGVIIAACSPAVAWWAWRSGTLPPIAAGFAVLGGAAYMVGDGLVSVNRASARIANFTLCAIALQFGTTLPRLGGLIAGGVTGCFVVMAVYYVGLALLFCRPRPGALPRLGPMLASGLPLFVFYSAWLVYASANRWVSWAVSDDPGEFGLFAFGASFPFIGAGVISNIGQVRYPRVIVTLTASPSAGAKAVATDIVWLSMLAAAAVAVAIPIAAQAIEAVFPRFSAAAPSALALAVSGVPLAVVAWTLPLCISLSNRPWRDALAVFGAPFLLLAPAMWVGERTAGLVGQAWGSTLDAWLLAVLQVVALRQVGALTLWGTLRSALLPTALVVLLCAVIATAHAEPTVPACRPQLADRTFNDEFQRLQLGHDGVDVWSSVYPWGGRTIPDNQEQEFYVDPRVDPPSLSELFPLAIDDGLTITARRVSDRLRPLVENLPFASGVLVTAKSFNQTYGYFEIRAKMPRGRGMWPAFWLIPADLSWPPEIDVVEAHGDRLDRYWASVHWRSENGSKLYKSFRIPTPDLSEAFHDFGVEWGPARIRWTFDGRLVAETSTPPGVNKPMYLVVNLALDKPDATTVFPASLRVQRVTAYRLADCMERDQ